MPRKTTKSLERVVAPDKRYNSVLVQKLINKTMMGGKKSLAQAQVYEALELSAKKLKLEDPLEALENAMQNIYPEMETRSRRVGGANYQIPFPVKGRRRRHLAIMWLSEASRDRRKGTNKSYAQSLADEIVDAVNKTGSAHKKREDVHKMAESNRAFAHFAR